MAGVNLLDALEGGHGDKQQLSAHSSSSVQQQELRLWVQQHAGFDTLDARQSCKQCALSAVQVHSITV